MKQLRNPTITAVWLGKILMMHVYMQALLPLHKTGFLSFWCFKIRMHKLSRASWTSKNPTLYSSWQTLIWGRWENTTKLALLVGVYLHAMRGEYWNTKIKKVKLTCDNYFKERKTNVWYRLFTAREKWTKHTLPRTKWIKQKDWPLPETHRTFTRRTGYVMRKMNYSL